MTVGARGTEQRNSTSSVGAVRSGRLLPSILPGTSVALMVGISGSTVEVDDVRIAHEAGAALLGGDFAVYAHHPEAQMGPLALAMAGGLPRLAFIVVVCAAMAALLAIAIRLGAPAWQVGVGGLLLAVPWAHLAVTGHADDPLVILGAAAVVLGLRQRSELWILGGFIVAMAGKPTAVLLLGLVVLAGFRIAASCAIAVGAMWAPLVLADPRGFLSAGEGIALVQPWSGPYLFGADVGDAFPAWVRPAQLIGCVGLAYAAGRWRGPAAGLVAAVAFRVALEPGAWPSYCASLVAVCLLVETRFRLPMVWASLAAWCVSWLYPLDAAQGLTRMLLLVVVGSLTAAAAQQHGAPRRALHPAPRALGHRRSSAPGPAQ